MRTVGAYEAKTHLPQLLDDVAHGETIIITKRGVAVARLVPTEDDREARKKAVVEMKRFKKEHNWQLPEGMSIRDMIEEGRRF